MTTISEVTDATTKQKVYELKDDEVYYGSAPDTPPTEVANLIDLFKRDPRKAFKEFTNRWPDLPADLAVALLVGKVPYTVKDGVVRIEEEPVSLDGLPF